MVNSGSRKGNFKHNCYTCNKSAFVQRHVLLQKPLFEIHASLTKHKRRLTVTPCEHVSDISELGPDKFMNMYIGVKEFLESYDVAGFEMSFKTGDWMRHDHQHSHILIEDKYLDRILSDFNITQTPKVLCPDSNNNWRNHI